MNRLVQRGSTDVSAWVQLLDANGDYVTGMNYSDVTITARRFLGGRLVSEIAITPASLTAINDAHADGGFVEDSSRKRYRVDLTDACVATGLDSADNVELKVTASGVVGNTSEELTLVSYDWTSGQASSVTVAPLQATSIRRVNGEDISYFVGETIAQTVAITDANGAAVDLSAKTLSLIIESKPNLADIQTVTPSVGGASNNQITFTNNANVTKTARTLKWVLRDTAGGNEVFGRGDVIVSYAPR